MKSTTGKRSESSVNSGRNGAVSLEHIYERFPNVVLYPYRRGTKGPRIKGWPQITFDATLRPAYVKQLRIALQYRHNIGIKLGPTPNGWLACVDIDSDKLLEEFLASNPRFKTDVFKRVGAKGAHFYFYVTGDFPKDQGSYKADWGEFRIGGNNKGSQAVLLGEHGDKEGKPDGIFFRWEIDKPLITIDWSEIKWPASWKLTWNKEPKKTATKESKKTATEEFKAYGRAHPDWEFKQLDYKGLLKELGIQFKEVVSAEHPNRVELRCPLEEKHTTPNADTDCAIWQKSGHVPTVECYHTSCQMELTRFLDWCEEKQPGIVSRYCSQKSNLVPVYDSKTKDFYIPDKYGRMTKVNQVHLEKYLLDNKLVSFPSDNPFNSYTEKLKQLDIKISTTEDETYAKKLMVQREAVAKERRDVAKALVKRALSNKVQSIIDEFSVSYAGPLAGYQTGYQEMLNTRILVTESPKLITPYKCDDAIIVEIIANQYGIGDEREDWIYIYSWLKLAREILHSGNFRPGLALLLCGPKGSGKNLVQDTIITPLLGGKMADPTKHALGYDFNDAAIRSTHLRIADSRAIDKKSAVRLGAYIKSIAGNREQELHPKGRPAFTGVPFWRLSMSFNEEKEDLEIVPDIDDDAVAAKIILLYSEKKPIPMGGQYDKRAEAIAKALPGFAYRLQEFEIPEKVLDPDQRYEVRPYCSPKVRALIESYSNESKLLDIINQSHIFEGALIVDKDGKSKREIKEFWEGTAKELLDTLNEGSRSIAWLVTEPIRMGHLLAKLAKRKNSQVSSTISRGTVYYRIINPARV